MYFPMNMKLIKCNINNSFLLSSNSVPPFKSPDAPIYSKLSMLITSMMGLITRLLSYKSHKMPNKKVSTLTTDIEF